MTGRQRGTGLESIEEKADAERKDVLDPHHESEIAMLEASLDAPFLSPQGRETTRDRLAFLRRVAPRYDGRRMI